MARIALDAMGGDFAPQATVAGALLALGELDPAHSIQLVGRTAVITETARRAARRAELRARSQSHRDRITIVEAPGRHRDDGQARRRRSRKAQQLHDRRPQAAGRRASPTRSSPPATPARRWPRRWSCSGCTPASSARPSPRSFRRRASRSSCSTPAPTSTARADELVQFARLGAVYAEDMLGRANPAVGLLSIGEEPEKGNAVVEGSAPAAADGRAQLHRQRRRTRPARAAHAIAARSTSSSATASSATSCSSSTRRSRRSSSDCSRKAGVDQKTMMGALKQLDYSEHGGAPLLGVNGVSIISHGKSSPRAIKNAIKVGGRRRSRRSMDEHIGRRLQEPRRRRRRMKRPVAYIAGTGRGLPAKVFNEPRLRGARHRDDRRVDRRAHGHPASGTSPIDGETTCSMAAAAARQAMEQAGVHAGRARRHRAQHGDAGPAAAVDRRRSAGGARRDARRGVRHRRRLLRIHLRLDGRRRA